MKIESVFDAAFAPYGKVLPGYDTSELLAALEKYTPLPEATDYVASQPELEALPIAAQLASNAYGGMPIQLGWCNGHNTRLNCLEYHRDSEINCGTADFILLVARAPSACRAAWWSRSTPLRCTTPPAPPPGARASACWWLCRAAPTAPSRR